MRRILLAVYVVALLALMLAPLPESAYQLASAKGLDKAVHFALFGGLAVLLYWNLKPSGTPTLWRVVGPSGFMAALVELLQAPLRYRTADIWDFVWGLAGSLVAYLLVRR